MRAIRACGACREIEPEALARLVGWSITLKERARLYVDLRNERVTAKIAGTGAYILTAITKSLEVGLLEQPIEALEEQAGLLSEQRADVSCPGSARCRVSVRSGHFS